MWRAAVMLAACGCVVVAWAGGVEPGAPGVPGDDPPKRMHSEMEGIAPPETKAGGKMQFVLDVLNAKAELGEVKERFSAAYLERVPEADTRKLFEELRREVFEEQAVRLVEITTSGEESLSGFINGNGRTRAVFLVVDAQTGKIADLRFEKAARRNRKQGNWDSFSQAVREEAPEVSFGAYEVVVRAREDEPARPELVPVQEVDPDKRLSIGNSVAVFVLGAVAERVRTGKASWGEEVRIVDGLKSLPPGTMQNEPTGSAFPLREYARRMYLLSDNTAADHLIARVGLASVEKHFEKYSGDPLRTLPLLTTRQVFQLKLVEDGGLRRRFIGATEDEQREMVGPGGEVSNLPLDEELWKWWRGPVAVGQVGWFASAREVCQALADLHGESVKEERALAKAASERGDGAEPEEGELARVLFGKPGMAIDREVWTRVGYKGGGEPGALHACWVLERADGRVFVMSVGWNDPKNVLNERKLFAMARNGVELLGNKDQTE